MGCAITMHTPPKAVKPESLMRYLVRLVTPPNGTVLDPFMGSGSTGKAAVLEGFRFVGIEQSEEYCEIGVCRIGHAESKTDGVVVGKQTKAAKVKDTVVQDKKAIAKVQLELF